MNYRISDETLAVLPISSNNCEIIEKKGNLPLGDMNAMKVIENSCEYFGVNYKNRIKSSYKFINTRYKAPVIIEERLRIIFFPLSSPSNSNNYWISYNNILTYRPSKKKRETIVTFKNGLSMRIPVSYYVFNSQYCKAARLYASYEVRSSRIM